MKVLAKLAPLLVLAVSSQAFGQDRPRIRDFPIRTIEQLGQQLLWHDLAAAAGGDALLAAVPNAEELGLLGWITTEDEQGLLVTYVGLAEGRFVAKFEFRPESSPDGAVRSSRDRPLSDAEMTRFMARMTALRQQIDLCSSGYHTVILEDPESDGWLVYLMADISESGMLPVDGHFRISVSADGTHVEQIDKLFDSCRSLNVLADSVTTDSGRTALAVSRSVGTSPLETDVFFSLLFGIDFIVDTEDSNGSWTLEEGDIERAGLTPDVI